MNIKDYWNNRYLSGDNSGVGSYSIYCDYKAKIINDFIENKDIKNVLDLGCGDGNQLKSYKFDSIDYVGVDISEKIVNVCKELFSEDNKKLFMTFDDYRVTNYDLCLSIDVLYHLVNDIDYNGYFKKLFDSSDKYVIIYSSNFDTEFNKSHVRHREFTKDIPNNFELIYHNDKHIGVSCAEFFIYKKL